MSEYTTEQIPLRITAGAAAAGLGLVTYGLYKAGVNLDLLSAGGISSNPFAILPPAAAALLTAGATAVSLGPHSESNSTPSTLDV